MKALPLTHIIISFNLYQRVIENKIAYKVNLDRRGVGVQNNFCCLCKVPDESTSHLFFGCRVVWLVWNLCYDLLGVSTVDPLVSRSHFEHFQNS